MRNIWLSACRRYNLCPLVGFVIYARFLGKPALGCALEHVNTRRLWCGAGWRAPRFPLKNACGGCEYAGLRYR